MNKYLTMFNEITKKLEEKFGYSRYSVLSKLQISAEMESILGWEEFDNVELTDKEQEELIEIIYEIYMDSENDLGVFVPTKAVMETLLEDYKGNYKVFKDDYTLNNSKVYDKIVWKLDY